MNLSENMKKIILFVFVLALLTLGACQQAKETLSLSQNGQTAQQMQQNSYGENDGRVVVGVTDAAADMNAVTSIKVVVNNVQLKSTTGNWINLKLNQNTFDLLALKNEEKIALLSDMRIPEGEYDQMRLEVSQVSVVDNTGEHVAKLPSNEMKLNGEIIVKNGETATAVLDVIADESLHTTGQGDYILAPVIKLQTRENAQVDVSSDEIKVNSGQIITDATVGMDATGKFEKGLKINKNDPLSITQEGKIKVGVGFENKKEDGSIIVV